MTDAQYYTMISIGLVGILMNGGLFIYLGGRVDKVVEKMSEIEARLAVVERELKIR